jgi:hypothetical protein
MGMLAQARVIKFSELEAPFYDYQAIPHFTPGKDMLV